MYLLLLAYETVDTGIFTIDTKPRNKYRAFGYFGMATFYYVAFAFVLMTGVLPGKSGDPAKSYQGDPGFFWIYISITLALFLYQLIRGIIIYCKQRKIGEVLTENRSSFTTRAARMITAIVTISLGVCLLILPIVEILKATAYGGYVFKTHRLSTEPTLFFPLLLFHFIVTFLPIIGGVLLLAFPPKITLEIQTGSQLETSAM